MSLHREIPEDLKDLKDIKIQTKDQPLRYMMPNTSIYYKIPGSNQSSELSNNQSDQESKSVTSRSSWSSAPSVTTATTAEAEIQTLPSQTGTSTYAPTYFKPPTYTSDHLKWVGGWQTKTNDDAGPQTTYALHIRQQPRAARVSRFGERDRGVVDPPPILELRITLPTPTSATSTVSTRITTDETASLLHYPHYVVRCSLWDASSNTESGTGVRGNKQYLLIGTGVANPFVSKDEHGVDGCFFFFPDLGCLKTGQYRLEFKLVNLAPITMGRVGMRGLSSAGVTSDVITVYAAKDFPGMQASTPLTMRLRAQGCFIPTRKGIGVNGRQSEYESLTMATTSNPTTLAGSSLDPRSLHVECDKEGLTGGFIRPREIPEISTPLSLHARLGNDRLFCDLCNDCEGFRFAHELARHKDRQHNCIVRKWVCIEPTDEIKDEFRPINALADCRSCHQQNKKYGNYYNAAAHLRRAHFVPMPRYRNMPGKADDKAEKRWGKGGSDWPPMKELKRWMREVYETALIAEQDLEETDETYEETYEETDEDEVLNDFVESPTMDAAASNPTNFEQSLPNPYDADVETLDFQFFTSSLVQYDHTDIDGHMGGVTQKDAAASLDSNLPTTIPITSPDPFTTSGSLTPYLKGAGSLHGDLTPPDVSPLPTGDDCNWELTPSNSEESPSNTSGQTTEQYEEDEQQLSDCDSIDTCSKTYPSFDPVKRSLFDYSTRQFWNFYNGISSAHWIALWSKHADYTGAASSSEGAQKSTHTTLDAQIPSKCPSNARSSASKRPIGDDKDDANNSERPPSKRLNNTRSQKCGLNLACPFYKYNPGKYNHGTLCFRTCSTTPFSSIFRLKEHLRRVHSPPIICTRCWLSFTNQDSLINHSQSDIPCQKKPVVVVRAWTTEMHKHITKSKDETERECWGRIYRELFGASLSNIPSPDFVPCDVTAGNEAELENLLFEEVPRIVLDMIREDVNALDIPDAARALFDSSVPALQIESRIGSAIREVCARYRSRISVANNSAAPSTPQSLSSNQSVTARGDRALRPSGSPHTSDGSLQDVSHPGGTEASSTTVPLMPIRTTGQSSNTLQPNSVGNPYSEVIVEPAETVQHSDMNRPNVPEMPSFLGDFHEQGFIPAPGMDPHVSEVASGYLPPVSVGHRQNAEQDIRRLEHDLMNAFEEGMDDYDLADFDFHVDSGDDVFLNDESYP